MPAEPIDPHGTLGRIPIRDLRPQQPGNRWPAVAFAGEVVPFEATVFREGHGELRVDAEIAGPAGTRRVRLTLVEPGLDRWRAEVQLHDPGRYRWRVFAAADDWATWLHAADAKIPERQDVELVFAEGAALLARIDVDPDAAAVEVVDRARRALDDQALDPDERLAAAHDDELAALLAEHPIVSLRTASEVLELVVERERAAVGAWYELFPRSEGAMRHPDGSWTSGTFRTAAERLPAIAEMGFDVLYLPPIHPVGVSHRKGPDNSLDAGPHDPGSPWAVGGPLPDGTLGGHDAVHPELGTLEDFRWFVARAAEHGIEVALDLVLQCSPEHPWVTEHPEWFAHRPDGSIAYAENPPKKYQDVYPLDFDADPEGLWPELLRIVEQWIAQGVRIFRVDNPHTKPLSFWEWLLAEVARRYPDVVFLAEAFARPPMLHTLAACGFQQSYTYFTWRTTKPELEEFLTGLATETADYLRPNLWVNTPDILPEFLQHGGRPAFLLRAAIAATASPAWGVYSGYELCENEAIPGTEEYRRSEKYEYRPRDWAAAAAEGRTIAPYLAALNRLRREHPALRQLRNLRVHWSDDDAVLVYSKHLGAAFTGTGRPDTVIVIVNLDPHAAHETDVHLDLSALGIAPGAEFPVRDALRGEARTWGEHTRVRLEPEHPALVLTVDHDVPRPGPGSA